MKISNSVINMSSQHSMVQAYSKEESLQVWNGTGENRSSTLFSIDELVISEEAMNALRSQGLGIGKAKFGEPFDIELSNRDTEIIRVFEETLSRLLGKDFKFWIPKKIRMKEMDSIQIPISPFNGGIQIPSQGWGIHYQYRETYQEQERMSFQSQGIVKTADGKEIRFDVELHMSRSFFTQTGIDLRAGDALVDPIVINYDGIFSGLTDQKFRFDLDADGKEDQISFLKQGSGFLALDLNEDGIINDGSELFGPRTGSGFQELSHYDSDGNGWIDENDPVFHKLRIWTKDEKGNDILFGLGEKGIGALYLGNIHTAFSVKDSQNETQAQLKQTGIFLRENGTVGTMQEFDLKI